MFSLIVSELFPVTLGAQRVREMDWREFLSVSIPCGLVTSGDVGLSNLSLVRISITFYTMVKSSTPVFVLLWAYFFNLETITPLLVLVVAVIAAGECLTVMGEVDYDWIGLIMCLGASVLSGARSRRPLRP
jgi:solute carrier family 35 protein C2